MLKPVSLKKDHKNYKL